MKGFSYSFIDFVEFDTHYELFCSTSDALKFIKLFLGIGEISYRGKVLSISSKYFTDEVKSLPSCIETSCRLNKFLDTFTAEVIRELGIKIGKKRLLLKFLRGLLKKLPKEYCRLYKEFKRKILVAERSVIEHDVGNFSLDVIYDSEEEYKLRYDLRDGDYKSFQLSVKGIENLIKYFSSLSEVIREAERDQEVVEIKVYYNRDWILLVQRYEKAKSFYSCEIIYRGNGERLTKIVDREKYNLRKVREGVREVVERLKGIKGERGCI